LDRKAEVALAQTAVAAVLWGTSFPVISVGIGAGLDPRTFVFLRFLIAAPMTVGVAAAMGRRVGPLMRSRGVWVLGFLNATGFVCQFIGQKYTDASVAALLVNLSVVLAAAGGVIFLGEKLGALKVFGVLLAVAGTFMIATGGSLAVLGKGEALGDGLYLVAAVMWAGYIVYAKMKDEEMDWDPIALAAGIVVATTVFVFPVALTGGLAMVFTPVPILAVLYSAVFNTAISFVLYQQGLKRLSASSSAVVLMLEIVVAVLISVTLLGQGLSGYGWAGAAAVLGSIALVSGLEGGRKSLSVEEPGSRSHS
jgi:drug/metabolite transporter (DMT)-like permease